MRRHAADALGRIRKLEQEPGVPIVERGQRFHGLTPEGERVLTWTSAILDDWSSLQQEIASLRNASGALTGHLTMGVVPSALPMAALITKAIQAKHPRVELTVPSSSSIDILKKLEEFSLDVGLTYLDNEPIEGTSLRTGIDRAPSECARRPPRLRGEAGVLRRPE